MMAGLEPWSGQSGWHIARWGPLGWAETAVKIVAVALAVTSTIRQVSESGFAGLGPGPLLTLSGPDVARLLITAVALGYVITVLDRWVDREVISMVFVIATLVGHWSMVLLMGSPDRHRSTIFAFAVLMMVGDVVKLAYFVTTGAKVRALPRAVPIVMTLLLVVVYLFVAVVAITA